MLVAAVSDFFMALFIGMAIGFVMNIMINFLADLYTKGGMTLSMFRGPGKAVIIGGLIGPFSFMVVSAGWGIGILLMIIITGVGSTIWEMINTRKGDIFNSKRAAIDALVGGFVTFCLIETSGEAVSKVAQIQQVAGMAVLGQRLGIMIFLKISETVFGKTVEKFINNLRGLRLP